MITLANRIKSARLNANLTQKALATKVGVAQPVISQLETGKNFQSAHLTKIAHVCGVSGIWLSDGIGPMTGANQPESSGIKENDFQMREPGVSSLGRRYRVPLISLSQVLEWTSGRYLMADIDAEMELPCPVPVGERAFAFRMPNDSMGGANNDISIQEDWVVFIDPDAKPKSGEIALASINGAEPILGVMTAHGGRISIKPSNPLYAEELIDPSDLSWCRGRAVFAGFFL